MYEATMSNQAINQGTTGQSLFHVESINQSTDKSWFDFHRKMFQDDCPRFFQAKKDEAKKADDERIRMENVLHGNPLLGKKAGDFTVKRRWDDDVVFKNCAKGQDDKNKPKNFINDSLRSEFHKKFMDKYIKWADDRGIGLRGMRRRRQQKQTGERNRVYKKIENRKGTTKRKRKKCFLFRFKKAVQDFPSNVT